jgi:hypothetical protein
VSDWAAETRRRAGLISRARSWARSRAIATDAETISDAPEPGADVRAPRSMGWVRSDVRRPSGERDRQAKVETAGGRGGVDLPPLPPLTDDDVAGLRTTPWRLSDELPDLDGGEPPALEGDRGATVVHELLERRAAWSATRVQWQRYGSADGRPVALVPVAGLLGSWHDPDRRGWLVLSILFASILVITIVSAVLRRLDTPVLPAHTQASSPIGTQGVGRDALTETIARPEPTVLPTDARVPVPRLPAPTVGRWWPHLLPITLGAVWLLGAWVIDREARRALVVRGTWRDRPTFAYTVVAVLVVTPIMLGGVVQSAWGVVSLLLEVERAEGANGAWRGIAILVSLVVGFLVLRLPAAASIRWLADTAVRTLRQARVGRRTRVRGRAPDSRSPGRIRRDGIDINLDAPGWTMAPQRQERRAQTTQARGLGADPRRR